MSIMGAINVGVTLGKAASGFIFNYTKSKYEAKITVMEGLLADLEGHKAELEVLKEEIPQFWNDDNAYETKLVLDSTIRSVEHSMFMVKQSLETLRTVVNELDGSKEELHNHVTQAKALLDALL